MKDGKKVVITYGTFDLFHEGHLNILKRAKKYGDFLIVGVTSENYDKERGKLNVKQSLEERIENVRRTGLADMIIVEEREGQKVSDIQKYNVDIFVIGDDWKGKFDYLKKYCEVIYLPRTKGVSSTLLRGVKYGIVKLGIIGYGNIAHRFVKESKYVSGLEVLGVYGKNKERMEKFVENNKLSFYTDNIKEFLQKVDAVYIATPHIYHYEYSKLCLENGKHVLVEKPAVLKESHIEELIEIAKRNNLVFLEGIKTLFCPGFIRLVEIVNSGYIGDVKYIDASFTKLILEKNRREFKKELGGGAFNELGSYIIGGFVKLLNFSKDDVKDINFKSIYEGEVDVFTKLLIELNNAIILDGTVGLKVKREGDMVIGGTKGYIYVKSPWWKTQEFEIRDDNGNTVKKYFKEFKGDGLRYEIAEFINMIQENNYESWLYNYENMKTVAFIFDKFNSSYL